MISRKATIAIADAFVDKFSKTSTGRSGYKTEKIHRDLLYDYLFEHEYEPWFCNASKTPISVRLLKEWILKIHTGETLHKATPDWPWEKRQSLGQEYLKSLAKDILNTLSKLKFDGLPPFFIKEITERNKKHFDNLVRRLEIDGYIYKDNQLYKNEDDILNVEEELNLLEKLHLSLKLPERETTFFFLKLSEEHYIAGKWSDSISNSRKFFEAILQQVATKYSECKNITENTNDFNRPVGVRNFLESNGLIEKKEREAVDKIYGLLSHTGSHPYMAENDQARLLRQISLTITQFIMLRLEGSLK